MKKLTGWLIALSLCLALCFSGCYESTVPGVYNGKHGLILSRIADTETGEDYSDLFNDWEEDILILTVGHSCTAEIKTAPGNMRIQSSGIEILCDADCVELELLSTNADFPNDDYCSKLIYSFRGKKECEDMSVEFVYGSYRCGFRVSFVE